MSGIRSLLNVISGKKIDSGRIVASTETTLSVATRAGVMVVPREALSPYSIGDEVKVANGAISGKLRSTDTLPVYYV